MHLINMIIRPANKHDLPYFLDLIHRINDDDSLGDVIKDELNDDHLNSLFMTVLVGGGLCYVAESDTTIGMIMGVINPNIWSPGLLFLNEVLYFVEPEYRHTRAAYLLFQQFDIESKKLIEQGRVHHVTFTTPKTLLEMDLERYDYELSEKTWIKKGMRYG